MYTVTATKPEELYIRRIDMSLDTFMTIVFMVLLVVCIVGYRITSQIAYVRRRDRYVKPRRYRK